MSRRWSDVVDLVAVVEGENANGFPENAETTRLNIFCNKKDVRSAEFYQAAAQGIRLESMFEVKTIDYEGEEKLIYDGKSFTVERTYDRGEVIELVCQGRGDDHGS